MKVQSLQLQAMLQHTCRIKQYSRRVGSIVNASRQEPLIRLLHHSSRFQAEPPQQSVLSSKDSPPATQEPGQKSTRRARFPSIVFLLLGLPVGWYLSQRQDGSHDEALDTSRFVNYTLAAKETVSSTCAILTLKPSSPGSTIPATVPGAEWSINSVEIKQPQLQIVRSYTCLPPCRSQEEEEVRLLVRREKQGEVSGYLHRLPIGSQLEIRGPFLEYAIPSDVERAVFIAGGTGIAPALQVADVLDGEADLHILWASKRREDCVGGTNDTPIKSNAWNLWSRLSREPSKRDLELATTPVAKGAIVSQLEYLKRSFAAASEGKQKALTVDYFIDEEGASISTALLKSIVEARPSSQVPQSAGRKVIFVSGPNGFISHWAGPKQWAHGQELQGPLGGVLSTLQISGWEVVKL